MSIAELKQKMYSRIGEINDEKFLQEKLHELMEYSSEDLEAIERIEKSEKFRREIETSLKQIEEGKVIPHEEMKKRMYL